MKDHTPGPWNVAKAVGLYIGGMYRVEYQHFGAHHLCVVEKEADARLIAASPDLLAALRWLVDDLSDAGEDRNPETGEEYDSVTAAREAIRKATA